MATFVKETSSLQFDFHMNLQKTLSVFLQKREANCYWESGNRMKAWTTLDELTQNIDASSKALTEIGLLPTVKTFASKMKDFFQYQPVKPAVTEGIGAIEATGSSNISPISTDSSSKSSGC